MRKINPKLAGLMLTGSTAQRLAIGEQEPLYFVLYYFTEFFSYRIAPFHWDLYDDIKKLTSGEMDEAAWVIFRESAKTSIAKLAAVIWWICFKKKRYINWDAYDKLNSEAALFDVIVQLQTNKKLLRDFGNLYNEDPNKEEKTMKRIKSFITTNDIKVEAFSTQQSTRGRVYQQYRPDAFILDDFETSKTIKSPIVTANIISHIDEMRAGLSPGASVLYLGNLIIDDGVVAGVMESMKNNPRMIARNIPVVNDRGKIAWPDKHVHTDKEAAAANKNIEDKRKMKVSLESKKRSLNANGRKVYETEMMNDPSSSDVYYGDRFILKHLMKSAKEYKSVSGGIRVWWNYEAKYSYGVGGDSSHGVGLDANALAVINYSTKPARLTATYTNDNMKPDLFGYELVRAAKMFGDALIVPEHNDPGYATIAQIIKEKEDGGCGYTNVYQRKVKAKIKVEESLEYGFRTSSATKPDLISQFFTAVESGELLVLSKPLLKEMYHYKVVDTRFAKPVEGMTRHFDLLMAAALAWEGRHQKVMSQTDHKKRYSSPQTKPYDTGM